MLGLDSAWPEAVTVVYQNIQFIFYLPARFFFTIVDFLLIDFIEKNPKTKPPKKKKKKYQLLPPNTSKLSQSLKKPRNLGWGFFGCFKICLLSEKKAHTNFEKKIAKILCLLNC